MNRSSQAENFKLKQVVIDPPDRHMLPSDKTISGSAVFTISGLPEGAEITTQFAFRNKNSVHEGVAEAYAQAARWANDLAAELGRYIEIYRGA